MQQKNQLSIQVVFLLGLISLLGTVACAAETSSPPSPVSINEAMALFKAEATNLGYVVQDGMPLATNLNDLYCEGSMWAPLYPNPNSPYISGVL